MQRTSPSVLIIRLDAIGDALALGPLLEAFAARSIPVDLVLREQNFDAFAARAVRERFIAPFELRSSTVENLKRIREFGTRLSERSYSHILVATEDAGGYRLAHDIGAPVRAGFHNGWGKPLKTLWIRSMLTHAIYRSAGLDARAPHECEVLFKLGAPLLGNAQPARDASRLRPLVLDGAGTQHSSIAVQVTDKWERLGIPFDDVVALVREVANIGPVRMLASAHERAYADRIAAAVGTSVECFSELAKWKAAIGSARALVAPDSGAIHVAGMTGTPTVAVFPTHDFALQAARWSPWAAPGRLVKSEGNWVPDAARSLAALIAEVR